MLPCSESMAHPCSSARHTGVTTRMHSRRNALICGTSPAAAPTRRGTGSRQEGSVLRAALPPRTVAAPASTGAFATPSRARSAAGSARDAAVVAHAAASQLPGRGSLQRCHAQPASSLGLFPAGSAALTVKLPALFLCVDADSVLQDPDTLPSISQAVAAGATAVLLSESPASGASALYDAACALRGTLRGRASLLLMDRTDIATAAEADGVVLTEQGAVCRCQASVAGAGARTGVRCQAQMQAHAKCMAHAWRWGVNVTGLTPWWPFTPYLDETWVKPIRQRI